MNISDIKKAFPDLDIIDLSDYYEKIKCWKSIFQNSPPWEKVKKSGLYKKGDRCMNKLNVAKVLCDAFADLTFSEQVEIKTGDDLYDDFISKTLNQSFWSKFPEFIAKAYALGGVAVKVYAQSGKIKINYVNADKFFPLGWDETINDCVIVSKIQKNEKSYTFFDRQINGKSEYKLFRSSNKSELGTECDLSELYEFPPAIIYPADVNMVSYFRPSTANNVNDDVPLGISIFYNATDSLKALDVAFDSLIREFTLGKKRIIVPSSAIQTVVDTKTGELVRYFDADDEAFVALKTEDVENLKITDNTVELRIEEHVKAINALLNILCLQVGLSAGTLSFDTVQGMKTATEVISQDSKTARTIKSNKNLLVETIENLIHSIISLAVFIKQLPKREYELTVSFKDSIIIDDNTLIDNNIKLVQAGLKSKISAIMEVQKCDEATAQKELERINKEQSITGLDVDDFTNKKEVDENDENGNTTT